MLFASSGLVLGSQTWISRDSTKYFIMHTSGSHRIRNDALTRRTASQTNWMPFRGLIWTSIMHLSILRFLLPTTICLMRRKDQYNIFDHICTRFCFALLPLKHHFLEPCALYIYIFFRISSLALRQSYQSPNSMKFLCNSWVKLTIS